MVYYMGKNSYVGIAKQDTAGTAETTADIFIAVENWPSIKSRPMNYYTKEYRNNTAEITTAYRKPTLGSDGSITAPAYENWLAYALYGIFGAVGSTGDDEGYTQTYTVAETLPIWTIFMGIDDLTVEKYPDMTMKNLSLSLQPGEFMEVSTDFVGSSGDIATAALTPSYTTLKPFSYADASVSIRGSADCDVESFEVTIDRGVQENKTICTTGVGAWEPNMVYPTTISVEGSMTLYFDGYDEYKYFLGSSSSTSATTSTYAATDADSAIILTVTSGEEIKAAGAATKATLTLTIHKAVWDEIDIDHTWDDRIKQTIAFKGMLEATPTPDGPVSCTLISSVADPDA